jgi:hypothetical protein
MGEFSPALPGDDMLERLRICEVPVAAPYLSSFTLRSLSDAIVASRFSSIADAADMLRGDGAAA